MFYLKLAFKEYIHQHSIIFIILFVTSSTLIENNSFCFPIFLLGFNFIRHSIFVFLNNEFVKLMKLVSITMSISKGFSMWEHWICLLQGLTHSSIIFIHFQGSVSRRFFHEIFRRTFCLSDGGIGVKTIIWKAFFQFIFSQP